MGRGVGFGWHVRFHGFLNMVVSAKMEVCSFGFSHDDWWCLTVDIQNIDTIQKFFIFYSIIGGGDFEPRCFGWRTPGDVSWAPRFLANTILKLSILIVIFDA